MNPMVIKAWKRITLYNVLYEEARDSHATSLAVFGFIATLRKKAKMLSRLDNERIKKTKRRAEELAKKAAAMKEEAMVKLEKPDDTMDVNATKVKYDKMLMKDLKALLESRKVTFNSKERKKAVLVKLLQDDDCVKREAAIVDAENKKDRENAAATAAYIEDPKEPGTFLPRNIMLKDALELDSLRLLVKEPAVQDAIKNLVAAKQIKAQKTSGGASSST